MTLRGEFAFSGP